MMKTNSDTTPALHIGLDVHKEKTSVAIADPGAKGEVRLRGAGELVSVFVPDETDEAVRDLCRARVDAIDDRRRAKIRLLAMLHRLGFNYSGKTTWTDAHN